MKERRHVTPLPLGDEVPFSKGLMARALVVTGLDPERAYLIAQRADRDLTERGAVSLDLDRLGELAAEVIGEECAASTVRRLRRLDALQKLDEPLLLLVGGSTGTGKSTIAAAIAGELGIGAGARVLRSDVLRKQLFKKAPEQRLPDEAYSLAVNERVYATIESRAATLLKAGHSVIIDAVSAKPEERAAIAEVARRAGARFTGLWLQASEATLLARLKARQKDASDATADVLRRQLTYDLGPMDWIRLDADRGTEDIVADIRGALRD